MAGTLRPVVFLDIDGVIGPSKTAGAEPVLWLEAVERLNRITDESGAGIVVSSWWRTRQGAGDMGKFLRERGVTGAFLGCTQDLGGSMADDLTRTYEILAWLVGHWPTLAFVVLDDRRLPMLEAHQVRVAKDAGLSDANAGLALAILDAGPGGI